MCAVMDIGVCIDMCVAMCADMCNGMCVGMCVDMCIAMHEHVAMPCVMALVFPDGDQDLVAFAAVEYLCKEEERSTKVSPLSFGISGVSCRSPRHRS